MYGIILDMYIRCSCCNSFSIPAYTYFTRFLGSQFHKKFIGSQFLKIYCVSEMCELFYVFVSQKSFVYWPVVVSWDLANDSVSFVLQNGAIIYKVVYRLASTHKVFWKFAGLGTPTWHHIPFLHSVSRFSSQLSFLCLHTYLCTNPDNGRLIVTVVLPLSLPR